MATTDIDSLFLACVGPDGEFGVPELRKVLTTTGVEELAEDEVVAMLLSLDIDGDGVVSLNDFRVAMASFLSSGATAINSRGTSPILSNGKSDGIPDGEENNARTPSPIIPMFESPHKSISLSLSSKSSNGGGNSSSRSRSSSSSSSGNNNSSNSDTSVSNRTTKCNGDSGVAATVSAIGAGAAGEAAAGASGAVAVARPSADTPGATDGSSIVSGQVDDGGDSIPADVASALGTLVTPLPSDVLTDVARVIDDLTASRLSAVELAGRAAGKRNETLEAQVRTLNAEYTRLETELTVAGAAGHRLQELGNELVAARAVAEQARNEVARSETVEHELRTQLAQALDAGERLRAELDDHEAEVETLVETIKSTEAGRATLVAESRDLRVEREAMLTEYQLAMEAIKTHENEERTRIAECERLAAEAEALAMRLEDAERQCDMREDALHELRDRLTERDAQIESLRANGGTETHTGSVLNEIEDLVFSQLKNNEANHNELTVGLLKKVLPSMPASAAGSSSSSGSSSGGGSGGGGGGGGGGGDPSGLAAVSDMGASADGSDGGSKADQVLRLYAASTQLMTGGKIIERETAEQMNVEQLKELRNTLKDLKSARSERLVNALAERDDLLHEISMKKELIIPLIARMGELTLAAGGSSMSSSPARPKAASASPTRHKGGTSSSSLSSSMSLSPSSRGASAVVAGGGGGGGGRSARTRTSPISSRRDGGAHYSTAVAGVKPTASSRSSFWSYFSGGGSGANGKSSRSTKSRPGSQSRADGTELPV